MSTTATEARPGLSARARIVGWLMLLVTVAVCALVVIAAQVMLGHAGARVSAELGHEGDKLRSFAGGVDPVTGESFRGVSHLLSAFLTSNLPDTHETFFSVVEGRADRRSPHTPAARLDLDHEFVRAVAGAREPRWGVVQTEAGPASYAVYPVRMEGAAEGGALVAVEFTGPDTEEVWSMVRMLALVALAALALAGLASWLIAGRVLSPIRLVAQTAERIGEGGFDERIEVGGTDDVAQLAATFNRMLDRVGAAFAGQRRFLDDASHELRTPITVVRGQLELLAADAPPAEREHIRALVLDELDRMSRIVDDLMLLAKAERPDFVLPQRVDLTELVMETLAKASPLGSRHWMLDEVAERTVWADGQRLTQALMQLVSNAVRHTGEGDEVGLGARVQSGRVLLWVRDTGSGIDPAEQQRIFERFVRLGGRERGEGAGLGLAIVATIAAAHGGRVTLISSPGRGATFTLELPLMAPPTAGGQGGSP